MSKYKFIYFDAGLTLLKSNHPELFKKSLDKLGARRRFSEIEYAYHLANKAMMRRALLHSREGIESFDHYFLSYLSAGVSRKGFREAYKEFAPQFKWSAYSYSKSVLEELKRDGYLLGVISNWDHSLRSILKREGLLDQFEKVIISSETGYEKPDARIFDIALKEAEVRSDECLFVGDNYYDDVIGAEQVGIKTALINPGRLGIEEIDYDLIIPSIEALPSLLREEKV